MKITVYYFEEQFLFISKTKLYSRIVLRTVEIKIGRNRNDDTVNRGLKNVKLQQFKNKDIVICETVILNFFFQNRYNN